MAEPGFQLFTSLRYDPMLATSPAESKGPAGWNHLNPSSPLYMLDFHRDRMLRAAGHWGWEAAIAKIEGEDGLARLEAFILGLSEVSESQGPLRVRVMLSKDGQLEHETAPVAPWPISNLFPAALPPPGTSGGVIGENQGQPEPLPVHAVVPDISQTLRSEYTHYKTTNRFMYDRARNRARIFPTDHTEVLILSKTDGTVMEGSVTTPYFWRNGRWVTPPVAPVFSSDAGSGGQDGTTRRWSLERGLCVEEPILASSLIDGEECWISNGVRGYIMGKIKLPSP